MSHFVKKCEFGKSHGTCRCMSKDKAVIKVPCDRPAQHGPIEPVKEPQPWPEIIDDFLAVDDGPDIKDTVMSLHERLQETVDSQFGNFISPIVKKSLVESLERDVVAWLLETAQFVLDQNKE